MPGERVRWTDRDTTDREGRNQLRYTKERELRIHVLTCPKPTERCADCWLLYRNIGTEAWNRHVSTEGGVWPADGQSD
jgi:hypothetical protein